MDVPLRRRRRVRDADASGWRAAMAWLYRCGGVRHRYPPLANGDGSSLVAPTRRHELLERRRVGGMEVVDEGPQARRRQGYAELL